LQYARGFATGGQFVVGGDGGTDTELCWKLGDDGVR
jgi:hypothetical protein